MIPPMLYALQTACGYFDLVTSHDTRAHALHVCMGLHEPMILDCMYLTAYCKATIFSELLNLVKLAMT